MDEHVAMCQFLIQRNDDNLSSAVFGELGMLRLKENT